MAAIRPDPELRWILGWLCLGGGLGLLGISEGTDGSGSIRIPAAWRNVVGFKPSFGRVPFVSRPNTRSPLIERPAFSPDMGVYPVDREVASVVAKAVGAFEECGAHVIESSLVLPHDQHELSDLWCRLIGTPEPLLGMRDEGYDLLGAHRSDLPE